MSMQVTIGDETYEVDIVRKLGNKNTYLRVKDDMKIHVTTNTFVTNREIEKIIYKNTDFIIKMINKVEKKSVNDDSFKYLGSTYDIIRTSTNKVILGGGKVFIGKDLKKDDIEKWYKKEAERIFLDHLENCYRLFSRNIPHPSLTIRKMTTRWGVCNTRDKRVTLNLELMRKPIYCLDYVIMHELSHLIYANHSREVWSLVEENCEYFKKAKKILKE
jgi:predicted metal-dependent hydrolase